LKFDGGGVWSFTKLNNEDKFMTGESSKDLLRFSSARENKVISRTNTFELNKSDKQMTLKPNDNVKTNINEKFIETIEETSE